MSLNLKDQQGQLNIEFLFCTLLTIILLVTMVPYLNQNISTNQNIGNNLEGREFLNELSDKINQLNSNSYGNSKYITIPETIGNYNYFVTIRENEIILEYDSNKCKVKINPIKIVDQNNKELYEKRLFNGGTYKLSKKLIDSNDSIINQSAIEIVRENDR